MPPELTYDQGQDVDFMMDITNPASPVVFASFVTATPAQKLAVHGQHLYVLDGASELYAVNLMP